MKIFVMSGDEPVYLPDFADVLFKERGKEIVGVNVTSFISLKRILDQYRLYGPFKFFTISMNYFYLLLKNRSVKNVAKKYSIPIYESKSVNSRSLLDKLRKKGVDLVISLYCPQIFRKELIGIPEHGCVNTHFGMLPDYRGISPIFWALLNSEKEVGVTVHFINEKVDDGKILLQEKVRIGESDKMEEIYRQAFGIAPWLLLKALSEIEDGKAVTKENDSSKGRYYTYPRKEDYERFKERCQNRI